MKIASLASFIPDDRIAAADVIRAAGGTHTEARVFSRLFGIENIAVSLSGVSLADHFAILLDRLEAGHSEDLPDAAIYTHSIPVQYQGRASPLESLRHRHPFLSRVRHIYEVDQQNCASLFWALDMARGLLVSGLARNVVIVAGDSHAELPLSERYIPACTLLGDAFAALTVNLTAEGSSIEALSLKVRPEFSYGQYGNDAEMRAFHAAHSGFVRDVLSAVDFPWTAGEPILAHNINRLVWSQFCREHALDPAWVKLDLVRDVGHCYTADPLLLLDHHLSNIKTDPAKLTMLSVGLGAYVGGCRIVRNTAVESGGGNANC